jgi:glycosyltransferase involved in cell wall biosynthesis
MVTYNHEKYIGEAIRSVLRQTCADLELVVVDDGSTDGTAGVIAQFNDPRLVYIHQENGGPGSATNRALGACRGRYIALMTGDDLCYPDRLEVQLAEHARAGGGLIFSNLDYVDDAGRPLESCHYPKDMFAIPPMTQGQILERFFRLGPFINGVPMFGAADALRSAGPLDPALYQLQDWDWLIRLVKKHPFTFLQRPTVSYRVRSGNGNLSAFSPHKIIRSTNDYYLVLRRFFDSVSPELFLDAFGNQLLNLASRSPLEIAGEQAFLFARHPHLPLARMIGMEKIHTLLSDPEGAAVLRTHFSFTPVHFANLLLHLDPLNQLARYQTLLYVDTGNGFHAGQTRQTVGNHCSEEFELTYDLSGAPPVRLFRWDPAEMQFCQVWLEEISWRDSAGRDHPWSPAEVWSNGRRGADGSHDFQSTLDPMIFLPITGDVARLTLRGRWRVIDPEETLRRVRDLLPAQEGALRQREQELLERDRRLQQCAQELHEQNVRLQEGAQELHGRDLRLLECARQMHEQNVRQAESEQQLRERELQLEECRKELHNTAQELHEREGQLAAIWASRSWRFFNWLRTHLPVRKKAG